MVFLELQEAAATFGKKFYPPEVKDGNDEKASDYVKVTVEKPELCYVIVQEL